MCASWSVDSTLVSKRADATNYGSRPDGFSYPGGKNALPDPSPTHPRPIPDYSYEETTQARAMTIVKQLPHLESFFWKNRNPVLTDQHCLQMRSVLDARCVARS